jgi:UDP-N-acetylglucosamine 4,6-dehydratase/5-epimerase
MKLQINNYFKNKSVLVTGGTGTIGSALVLKLLQSNCKVVRVLTNDENGLFELSEKVKISSKKKIGKNFLENMFNTKIRYFLGDIRDYERCEEVTANVDIVIHAAAIKHVNIAEYNPFEVTKTNVVGTQNILRASISNKVSKFLLISTDKVVSPVNIMGISKLQSEKITINSAETKGKSKTKVSCVRFGNILGSRGSVVPKYVNLLKNKKNIIVNHKEMARFVMTIDECTKMILKAIYLTKGKEIFILKSMKCFKIIDLANELLKFYNNNKSKIIIKNQNNFEKLYEELFNHDEINHLFDQHGFYIIKDEINKNIERHKKKFLSSRISNFNFQKPKEVISLLKKTGIIF